MKWSSLEESDPSTDPSPLREIYAERKDLFAKYVPTEIQKVHAEAVENGSNETSQPAFSQSGQRRRSSNSTIMTANSSAPSIY